jgi:hypothetical protein
MLRSGMWRGNIEGFFDDVFVNGDFSAAVTLTLQQPLSSLLHLPPLTTTLKKRMETQLCGLSSSQDMKPLYVLSQLGLVH